MSSVCIMCLGRGAALIHSFTLFTGLICTPLSSLNCFTFPYMLAGAFPQFNLPGSRLSDIFLQTRVLREDLGSMAVGVAARDRYSDMAIGRSISVRVPQSFEMPAILHLPGQSTALYRRSSSTGVGRIASEGRCQQLKLQHAGSRRKPEQTLSQLKDPKWKQLVKRVKGFVKRVGNDSKRSANPATATATLCSVMAVRPVPVLGSEPPRIPIWQRRNIPPVCPLNICKVRPSRSGSSKCFGM